MKIVVFVFRIVLFVVVVEGTVVANAELWFRYKGGLIEWGSG